MFHLFFKNNNSMHLQNCNTRSDSLIFPVSLNQKTEFSNIKFVKRIRFVRKQSKILSEYNKTYAFLIFD